MVDSLSRTMSVKAFRADFGVVQYSNIADFRRVIESDSRTRCGVFGFPHGAMIPIAHYS
jgi:hypothetical protein